MSLWLLLAAGVVLLVVLTAVVGGSGGSVATTVPISDLAAARWWEMVDKIFYINLDTRSDRRQHMEHVLGTMLQLPNDKVERVAALKESPGWRGCARSHIRALTLARERNYAYVCILEDDFQPLEAERFHREVQKAWQTLEGNFDVLMLGMTPIRLQRLQADPLFRIRQALAFPGQIVRASYFSILIQAFEQALAVGQPIDMLTQSLQASGLWYGMFPPIARQLPGYSDIENKPTNYGYLELEGRMLRFVD